MSKEIFEKHLSKTKKLIKELPWNDKKFYAEYLSQTYYFVRHSTKLLAKSISCFEIHEHELYRQFVHHLNEEMNHDQLALRDLQSLGTSIDQHPEQPITRAFYQSQYYQIETSKGLSLFGYILYLEALAANTCSLMIDQIKESHGTKSIRFLNLHMQEDIEHSERAFQYITSLASERQESIWHNYIQTSDLFQKILLDCQRISQERAFSQRISA